jgi:8-oxo-dGTP diphosphatase
MKVVSPAKHFIVVNILVFDQERVLVFKRRDEPFKDRFALPGGPLLKDELLEHAAKRKLKEQTGIEAVTVRFVGIYDALGRDPRSRVISATFLASLWRGEPKAGAATAGVYWVRDWEREDFAFDHGTILLEQAMFKKLSVKVKPFELLRPNA